MNEFDSIIGLNSKGFAKLKNEGLRPVQIEHVDNTGFYFCRDIETDKEYKIYRTDFMIGTTIPSKFRKHHFEAVLPYWEAALDSFPEAILIEPKEISSDTLCRKLREARDAWRRYKYPVKSLAKWEELIERILITPMEGDKVRLGPVDARKTIKADIAIVDKSGELLVSIPTDKCLEAFCQFVTTASFPNGCPFLIETLTPQQVESFEQRYSVGFVQRADNKWRLVI